MTVTATSSRFTVRTLGRIVLPVVAVAAAVAGCQSSAPAASHPAAHKESEPAGNGTPGTVPDVHLLAARQAPAGWHLVTLADGKAVLAYPPSMHRVTGDRGSASAAKVSASGTFVMYLNATPKQSDETLADWPHFRIEHLTDEDASSARLLAASHGVRFLGGTGTCVIDTYVTREKANRYTELACFVQGKTGSTVIVAAAPTADWKNVSGTLTRAVAAFRVR